VADHWHIYSAGDAGGVRADGAPIIIAEKKAKMKQIFMASIALAAGAMTLLMFRAA